MPEKKEKKIKCVVWDLDNTLWKGTILDKETLVLNEDAVRVIRILDERGILQSVASRNEYDRTMAMLKELELDRYFLYPQIGWGAKSQSVRNIAQAVNIGVDALAFVDDQLYELEEVGFSLPWVMCIDACDIARIPEMPEFIPK